MVPKFQFLLFISALLALASASVPGNAYVLSGLRWPGSHPRVPFHVSVSFPLHNQPFNEPFTNAIAAIMAAADTWNNEGNSSLRFVFAGVTDVTNVANDGINAIIFDPGPCPHQGTSCSAELVSHYGSDNILEGFDMIFYGFRADGTPIRWAARTTVTINRMDVESVALHEFGHAAGLDHSDVPSVMGSSLSFASVGRGLAVDDAYGIQAIYGPYTNDGLWFSNPTPTPGETVTLFLDYPRAARQSFQVVADFDRLSTGWDLRTSWPVDSRIFPLDRCPYPAGSRDPTALEAMILSANTGTLDSNGQARVTVRIPENLACFPTNRQWHFSVVTYGANPPSGIEDVGVAVALNIQTPQPTIFARRAAAGNTLELRWPARADYAHQLESSTTLARWTDFGPFLPALSVDGWQTSVVSVAQSSVFFRVRELPPPSLPCELDGVLALVVSTNHLRVPEGGTASFTVRLNGPPSPNVRVEIARTGGDANLTVEGDNQHTFRDDNWDVPKFFSIRSAPAANANTGVATFTLRRIAGGSNISSATVTAVKADDDL